MRAIQRDSGENLRTDKTSVKMLKYVPYSRLRSFPFSLNETYAFKDNLAPKHFELC